MGNADERFGTIPAGLVASQSRNTIQLLNHALAIQEARKPEILLRHSTIVRTHCDILLTYQETAAVEVVIPLVKDALWTFDAHLKSNITMRDIQRRY